MAPLIRATVLQTPGFFWPPMPTGHLTAGPDDVPLRELHARVERDDLRIVPLFNLPEVDSGEGLLIELERVRLDAADVDDHHHAAGQHRELAEVGGIQLLAGERIVGSAEIDGTVLDLVDSGAGAAALVVDPDLLAGGLGEAVGPGAIDRRGERCARSVDGNVGRSGRKRKERN